MSLAGCQINPIDVNFHLEKSLATFDKNSADKIWSKKDKEIKVSPLMPIRDKAPFLACRPLAGQVELLGSKIFGSTFLRNLKKIFYSSLDDFLGKKIGNLLAILISIDFKDVSTIVQVSSIF